MNLEKIVANLVQKIERRFYGKYRGLVVDNADPELLGRLKLRVPSVLGDNVVTGWALPCVPYGGDANQGMLFIPEVDAGVWVEFEEGDLEFPIWVGTFWSKPDGTSELPLPNTPDGTEDSAVQDPPTRKIIKTLKGHTIQFEDKEDEEMIIIVEGKHGHRVTMDKAGISIVDGIAGHSIKFEDFEDKDDAKITILEGEHGHQVTMDKVGISIVDGIPDHHAIRFDDTDNDEKITILEGKHGHQITMDKEGIKISDDVNRHLITLNGDGIKISDGKTHKDNVINFSAEGISITSKADITLTGQKIILKADGEITLDSKDKLSATGNPIHLNP